MFQFSVVKNSEIALHVKVSGHQLSTEAEAGFRPS